MTLLERMSADAEAFKLFQHSFEHDTLKHVLNKGIAMYQDTLYDLQLSNLVKSHIKENLQMISALDIDSRAKDIQVLLRECNLLCDYTQTETMKPNKEVGRY